MVTVDVAPLAVGVCGLVPVTLHVGNGEPLPLTAQVSLTAEAYPLTAVKVTVEVLGAPGLTAAGVVAEIVKSGAVTVRLTEAVSAVEEAVPITLITYVPAVVVPVVETVSAEAPVPPVTVGGTNAHVGAEAAFDGAEVIPQERLTFPLKLFSGAMVTVEVAWFPRFKLAGLKAVAEMVKAGAVTFKLTDAVCVPLGPVPTTVSVYAPTVVVLVVETVSKEVPAPPVTGDGTNWHVGGEVAPLGSEATLHDRLTLAVKPFNAEIVTVEVEELP